MNFYEIKDLLPPKLLPIVYSETAKKLYTHGEFTPIKTLHIKDFPSVGSCTAESNS